MNSIVEGVESVDVAEIEDAADFGEVAAVIEKYFPPERPDAQPEPQKYATMMAGAVVLVVHRDLLLLALRMADRATNLLMDKLDEEKGH